jgi:predicted Abi (CAAX) family protease
MSLKRLLAFLLVGVMGALMLADSARSVISSPARSETSYDLAQQAPFNRPEHYPLDQRPDPSLYKPHAEWMGRLILPARRDMTRRPGDWVWVVLEQAPAWPHADLIGRRLRLSWQESPAITNLIDTVSTDIQLGAAAAKSAQQGNVLPTRLDGRRSVGPLQSLAGARPHDDIIVELEEVVLDEGFTPGHQPDGERHPFASHRPFPHPDHRSMEQPGEDSWP